MGRILRSHAAPLAKLTATDRIHKGLPLADSKGLKAFEELARDLCQEATGVDLTSKEAKRAFHLAVMKVYRALVKTGYQFRKDNEGLIVRECLRYLRRSAASIGVKESKVQFNLNASSGFGQGLQSTVTVIPDPGLGANFEFGSQPNPKGFLGSAGVQWKALVRRRYQDHWGNLGDKPHYVLAHLLNHNVGGSGLDPKNLVPFWATANTEMSNVAEEKLKEHVNENGYSVEWSVTCGPELGMTAKRSALLQQVLDDNGVGDPGGLTGDARVQYDILLYEQHLPKFLSMSLKYEDHDGVVFDVGLPMVNNFVPMNIPHLM
ncbi:MAG: hypothetical protein GC160_29850 [Acidobacteria bacterium]|nr:hypothetical protein [Acidobacteriota bacterium]